ncbi:SCO family protein [Enemella sp. A6]|uniref:SCO family protein n=1 Tax=Enemella sp. A6 TaxID=3440152 RepID=UPI003EB8F344
MRPVWIVVGLALVFLAGCGSAAQTPDAAEAADLHGTEITEPYDLPDAVLTDTSGHRYRLASTPTSPIVVIVFGYSHCEPRCSETPGKLSEALAMLPRDLRQRITAILITVDPERDTAASLKEWLARDAPGVIGLTGERPDVEHVAERVGVAISGKQRNGQDGYFVGHGTQLIAFGPDRTAIAYWQQDLSAADIAADLQVLASR